MTGGFRRARRRKLAPMIRSTFRLAPGVGPYLESRLWERGISTWDNLHDTVNLRTRMDLGYDRMIARLRLPAPPVTVSERGDFRYDMTKALLAL